MFPDVARVEELVLGGTEVTISQWLPIWRDAEELADTDDEREWIEHVHRLVISQP